MSSVPDPATHHGEDDEISLVVITRDRWSSLRESLPRHEHRVVLVDNGSRDGTPGLVRRHFPEVQVVELAENRGAVARSIGVERARTPYVAFADDDSWWAPGALRQARSVFEAHPRLGLLAATTLVGPEQRQDPICRLMASSPLGRDDDLPGPSVLGFLACAAVVRRSAFLEAGGFDEVVFFGGEEERLALDLAALGWGLAHVDSVVSHHHPSPRRDDREREALLVRARLLTALLRRPGRAVAAEVVAALRGGPSGRAGLRAAATSLPQALARRRTLPPPVEAARRMLDRPVPPRERVAAGA